MMQIPKHITPNMVSSWQLLAAGTSVKDTAATAAYTERTIQTWKAKLASLSVSEIQAFPEDVWPYYQTLTGNRVPRPSNDDVELRHHHGELRQIAAQLQDEIEPPEILFSFLEDIGGRGIHWLPKWVGSGFYYVWEIDDQGKLSRLLTPIEADNAQNTVFLGLIDHMNNSGFGDVVDLLEQRRTTGAKYLEYCAALHDRMKIEMTERISVSVFPYDLGNAGLSGWFPLTICVTTLDFISGNTTAGNKNYLIEAIPDSNESWLRYDGYGIARSPDMAWLNLCQQLHEDLVTEYSLFDKHKAVTAIAGLRKDLSSLARKCQGRLMEFSHSYPLPGHCTLCDREKR
jgi:hypothetical protein